MSGKVYGVNPATDEYTAPPRVQDALSALLTTLGFTGMASDVLGEGDPARLRHYARVIEKNWPTDERRAGIVNSLRTLRLL